MSNVTFDKSVKRQKAVLWLVRNDPFVSAAYEHVKRSPLASLLMLAEHGELLESKIAEAAELI
jgi:hypothetical protein